MIVGASPEVGDMGWGPLWAAGVQAALPFCTGLPSTCCRSVPPTEAEARLRGVGVYPGEALRGGVVPRAGASPSVSGLGRVWLGSPSAVCP